MAIYDMANAIRQPDAGNFGQGLLVGQQFAQNRRQNQARNALARLAQGDQTALPDLMQADPEAGMKWQDMQRANEFNQGLQGFFKPATGATNVVGVNSLSALANPQPAQPAGYDFDGAMNYAASRGEIEKAGSLAALRDKMRPQSAKYYGGDGQEVLTPDGRRALIAMTEAGPVELPYQPVSKPKIKYFDDGTAVDETTGNVIGRVPVGLSPAQQAANQRAAMADNRPQLVQGTDANGNPTYEWVQPGQQPTVAPTRKEKTLSPTEFKELVDTEDKIGSLQSVLTSLDDALKINNKAYSGPAALSRAKGRSLLGGDTSAADATVELNNIISEQALSSLKTIFGGNPTEGERAILLEMQASVEKTPAQRAAIIARAKVLAERRLQASRERAEAIRGGTFSKPGGGKQQAQSGVRKDTSGLVNWLQGRNINNQDQFNQAVTEMKRRGWNEAEINQALDKAGL